MTKFPSPPPPILHTVSDQKLDGEKAWELYPMFTIKHINLLTPFSPLPLLLWLWLSPQHRLRHVKSLLVRNLTLPDIFHGSCDALSVSVYFTLHSTHNPDKGSSFYNHPKWHQSILNCLQSNTFCVTVYMYMYVVWSWSVLLDPALPRGKMVWWTKSNFLDD